jgi:hypothetical protein
MTAKSIITSVLHAYIKLLCQRPFLEHAEHLTEDVVSVFPAADSLEQYIMSVMASVVGEDGLDSICKQKLAPYQVRSYLP